MSTKLKRVEEREAWAPRSALTAEQWRAATQYALVFPDGEISYSDDGDATEHLDGNEHAVAVARLAVRGLCPVCGYEGEFGPITNGNARESMQCPDCQATSRQRAVAHGIMRSIELPGERYMTLPVWTQKVTQHVYQVGRDRLTPFLDDTMDVRVSENSLRPGCDCQNLERLAYPSASFTLIVCSEVLEHVRLYRYALAELSRVLKPGGSLILTVPLVGGDAHETFCEIVTDKCPEADIWSPDAPVHADPLDPAGCRVYRHYSRMQLMSECRAIGLDGTITAPNIPAHAIVNCEVFLLRRLP